MKAVIFSIVAWVAGNIIPADFIKAKLTTIITRLLNRFFDMADSLAARTAITDVDDKAATALRSWLMAEGVVSHFVDVVYALIFGQPAPAPVDPVNPPPVPVVPSSPGLVRRLFQGIGSLLRKAW